MENTKNKKWNLAHFCSYLSLIISITILILWCCNVGGFSVVSLDSFVGVIVALLAIIVTLAVGWQIYNSIEIKSQIEKLSTLKEKLELLEHTAKQQTGKSQHLISYILGNDACKEKNYLDAFRYFLSALNYSMQLESPLNVEPLLKALEQTNTLSFEEDDFKSEKIKDICTYDNEIRSSSCYELIRCKYEIIYNAFCSKVKYDKND